MGSLDGRPFVLRGVLFGQLLSLLLQSDFGIGLSSTPLDILECQKSPPHEFKVDAVKSFTVVDEAAIHVLAVFNLFLTDKVVTQSANIYSKTPNLQTSPKSSEPPTMSPQARVISPLKIVTPSNVISISRTPRYEWMRDLL